MAIRWSCGLAGSFHLHAELPSNGWPQRTPSKVLVNPVSTWDGEFLWTGLFFTQWYGLHGLRVQVFLQYTATDAFAYSSTPSPFGDRGDTSRWVPMAGSAVCTPFFQMLSLLPCTVTANGAAGHNRGEGGGDATSRKDTMQDPWLYFESQLRWSLFYVSCEGSPTLQWGGAQHVESQAGLGADATKSSGSLHSFQTTLSHRTTCRDTWEACGLTSESLARKAGNSAEMTGFTSEEILGIQWTASKGSDPRTAPRSSEHGA